MKKKLFLVLIMLINLLSFSGCAETKTQIAYTVYPVGYLVERLVGDTLTATSIQSNTIVQRSTINEDYVNTLKESALFLHIGELEPYMNVYANDIQSNVDDEIDLSVLNAIYLFQRYTPVYTDGQVNYIESPYYNSDAFNLVDTDEKDLYLWTDPIAMLSMAKDIRDWLVQKYPDNADKYNENCDSLENDLVRLDAEYQSLATSMETNNQTIKFVSMTASFGNWQKTYNIQVYPVILSKYGTLPTEEQLEIIKQRIIADKVKYIVYEPNMTDDMIELFNTLQEDLNLTRVELSNMSSLTDQQINDGKDYISIMYENLSVLQTMVESDETDAEAVTNNDVDVSQAPQEEPIATPE